MSIRTFALIAATALTAGVVGAQSASANNTQLALQADVEPGVYSTSQLIRLLDAERKNETNRVNFILREADNTATRNSFSSVGSAPSQSTSTFGTGVNSGNY